MAKKTDPAKTRLLAKARRLSEQLRRYAAFIRHVTRAREWASVVPGTASRDWYRHPMRLISVELVPE